MSALATRYRSPLDLIASAPLRVSEAASPADLLGIVLRAFERVAPEARDSWLMESRAAAYQLAMRLERETVSGTRGDDERDDAPAALIAMRDEAIDALDLTNPHDAQLLIERRARLHALNVAVAAVMGSRAPAAA